MVGLERGTVELEPYDPAWRDAYEREVEHLESVAGDQFLAYEHVGSTAVEGLAAKPIIDLIAVVEDLEGAREVIPTLEDAGYEYRPNDGVEGRIFLAKGPRSNRTHYLSVCEAGSDFYREKIAFRDFLRENPAAAAEYESLKRDLAESHADDRDAYTEAKGAFVRRILDDALDES